MATLVDGIKTPDWSMTSLLTTGTYWTLWGFFRGIARLCFHLRLTGQENIPTQGRLLIAANHASFLDVPFLGCGVARQLAFLGRHNLFPIPLVNPLLQHLGWIPIRQDRFDRDGLRRAEDCIETGKALVIFPEGVRTETGALGEGKLGLAMLVLKTKCLVVPAYISGTFEALPIGASRLSFHPVSVTYGTPIDFARDIERFTKKEFYHHVIDTVMASIRDLALTSSRL
jgi:1-acyl-sn-glycerol-3-phosphate acyltransferase